MKLADGKGELVRGHDEYAHVGESIIAGVPEFAESPEFAELEPEDRAISRVVVAAFARFVERTQAAALAGQQVPESLTKSYATLERLANSNDVNV